jgi:hypothetical protein
MEINEITEAVIGEKAWDMFTTASRRVRLVPPQRGYDFRLTCGNNIERAARVEIWRDG